MTLEASVLFLAVAIGVGALPWRPIALERTCRALTALQEVLSVSVQRRARSVGASLHGIQIASPRSSLGT